MRRAAFLMLLLPGLAPTAPLRADEVTPYLGYVYPAGARAGATVQVSVGGRNLGGVRGAWFSGGGVGANVVEHYRPLGASQIQAVMEHMRARTQELLGREPDGRGRKGPRPGKPAAAAELPPLPDHPLVRDIDTMTLAQLAALRDKLQDAKQQPRPQLAETVVLRVTVDSAAAPGDRELRLLTPTGLSNPVLFQVGAWPEVLEVEAPPLPDLPRRARALAAAAGPAAVSSPVVLNGQIMSGDSDRFTLQARQGQSLVVAVAARRLVPYIADAVPGWFQPVVTLYDATGSAVAYADDYRFDPDPVLCYRVPADGLYALEVRDALYRGRDDFVYRVSVSEQPWVTSVFPLGASAGTTVSAATLGWNLPWKEVPLEAGPGGPLRQTTWGVGETLSNPVTYAVDNLREVIEKEPNDSAPQDVPLPLIVNGRIGAPGDVDAFTFRGHAGDEVVAEVLARRLGSPLDSLLRLTDAGGKVLAWNDDTDDPANALQTHQADSYLRCGLPADGLYTVRITDTTRAGSPAHAYRLRLSAPRPDFALRVTPSGINIPAGRSAVVTAHLLRRDGFAGPVELFLVGAPPGFALSGAVIPADADKVRFTITAPPLAATTPVALRLEGSAQVGAETVTREAVPADDMMQAFAYRHLVPARELLATVTGDRRAPVALTWASPQPLRVPLGGEVRVAANIRRPAALGAVPLEFELTEAPAGLSVTLDGLTAQEALLTFRADAAQARAGARGNLIVEAWTQAAPREGRPARKGQRLPLGALPALSVEIVPAA